MVLPSNVPINSDEVNKTSCYKTYLPTPLDLQTDDWEVGLVQINYPHSWLNINDEVGNIKVHKSLNIRRTKYTQTLQIPPKFYTDITELINIIQDLLTKTKRVKSTIFKILNNKILLKIYPGESIHFHPNLAAMLGLKECKFENKTEEIYPIDNDSNDIQNTRNTLVKQSDQMSDLRIAQYNLFVYCDLIKLTLVGNVYVPLLHSIAIDDNPGKYIHKEFLNPHYIPLQNGSISNIQIRLCDDMGENVRFEWGKVIIKIHFRRRRHRS
jgi:hypothetical protein